MPVTDGPYLYGDSSRALGDHQVAGDQNVIINFLQPPDPTIAVGDAPALRADAVGGADTVTAEADQGPPVAAFGDALSMQGHSHGGDDVVGAGARGGAFAYGDAGTMAGSAVGGNDHVNASAPLAAYAYGDASLMKGAAHGGNDTVTGSADPASDGVAVLAGDADTMQLRSQGGNDLLDASPSAGGSEAGYLIYGDARVLADFAAGGNDTLVGGAGDDTMWGDAAVLSPHATTGADDFIFRPGGGHDQIMDFQPGKDRIDVSAFNYASFQDLATHFTPTANGVLISFDPNDDVLVRGLGAGQLGASDFLLA